MEFLDLNEDCLINLCRYCDAESILAISQTCTKMNHIAKGYFKFKRSYTCCIGSKDSVDMAARTIEKLGKYFTKIDLMFELGHANLCTEIFSLLSKSVGPHFVELSILGEICSMPLEILDVTFSQLEVLTLQNVCWIENCYSNIDLPSLCHNLRKLTVSGQIVFAPKPEKNFRCLKSLNVDFAAKQIPGDVFSANKQLTKLNVWNRRIINKISLSEVSTLLTRLEKLHLDVNLIEKPNEELPLIADFSNLHTLELYSIPASSFDDILQILEKCDRLKGIVLQSSDLTRLHDVFLSSQESLVRIAMKLTKLESFVTINIDWTSESVADFVRHARNLTFLKFWSGKYNYVITPEFIRELAKIRRLSTSLDEDCRPVPLQLKMFEIDDGLREVFNDPEVKACIKLSK